ncbi:MAG TPA: LecA/PA-IL family lectin [Acidimicrobiales bacterium]
MNEQILVALIGTIPGTLTAVVTLTRHRSEGEAPAPPSRNPLRARETPPTRLRFAVVLVSAAVVTAALALGLLAAGKAVNSEGPVEAEVDVPATQVWTNSGIELARGDEVVVLARGEIVHSTTHRLKCGPDGAKPNDANLLKEAGHGALLAKIGRTGLPFLVGKEKTFTASDKGELYLGVNDTGTDNNSGRFTADVEVSAG